MGLGYRSLYWRIGIGFIFCIAAVLAVQGTLLLALMNREDPDSRTYFTLRVSEELSAALSADPSLDIERFIRTTVQSAPRPFYIVLTSGEVFYFGDKRPSQVAIEGVREEFSHEGLKTIPRRWEMAPYWASPVYVNGALRGVVSVVARNLMADLWQPMAVLTLSLLAIGTAVASWFIFGPAHRRLKALEETARKLGAGDVAARAEEDGGDEVASLARTFNVMARDLAARADQILEYDRARRLLLADISHELMTPLTAIRGYQEKLSTDPAIAHSASHRRYVAIIGEEAQRVEHIVRDLLDLARFENGTSVLDIQDVSIEGLFGRVAARQESDATTRRVTLTTSIEPGAEIVHGDQFRLEQVLQNLAANALRHVPEGGTVALEAHFDRGNIILTVRDTGSGIAEQHLPFIFDRFYKVDSSRARLEGSGLGLSIVKAIVERHGGTIAVTSTPDVETVFTITLPAGADTVMLERSA